MVFFEIIIIFLLILLIGVIGSMHSEIYELQEDIERLMYFVEYKIKDKDEHDNLKNE